MLLLSIPAGHDNPTVPGVLTRLGLVEVIQADGSEMRRADINDLPNPFSIERLSVRPKTTSLTHRLKFFALIAILLASSLALGNQYTKYRFSRLSSDFAALSSPEKLDRLDQLSAWGHKAIPTIVAALGDKDLRSCQARSRSAAPTAKRLGRT